MVLYFLIIFLLSLVSSKVYIGNVRAINDSTSTLPLKNKYNNAIN
ncbi:MAG: hypothetical protein ACI93N_001318 [Flavobacteriaceae bacterium]|jgi:hypothetical protein